jgi:uncharacterized protein (TIGR03435 family)
MSKRPFFIQSALVLSALILPAQTPSAPTFEVAAIRPAAQMTPDLILSGKMHFGMKVDAARLDIGFMSLRDLVMTAYRVKPFQITGPDWITGQRFDVLATIPEGVPQDKVPEMLQALLAERFGLKVRRENKEVPVYSLTVAKNGPKFKESPPDADTPPPAADAGPAKPDGAIVIGAGDQQVRVKRAGAGGNVEVSGGPNGKMNVSMGPNGMMHMEMQKTSMARLAELLTPMLDRPVVDHTGLAGNFQIGLDLAMADMMQIARTSGAGAGLPIPAPPPPPPGLSGQTPMASDPSGGSIFQSVQQLGLRLEKEKAPFETIVIEHAEKNPTDN